MKWFTDQSRYMAGYSCPFSRLLRYHLNGTGWVPATEPFEPAVGHILHEHLESILKGGDPPKGEAFAGFPLTPLGRSEVLGLLHGYKRVVLPWILKEFDILSTEEEFSIDVGDDIVWMARPDAVLRSKTDHTLSILDFKSTRAKADRIARLHAASLQSIMNSYAVSTKYNEPVAEVQIHILQLGTETWPTPITHAYYRAANPPYVPEDWQPKSRRPDGTWLGKLYRRVQVHDHRLVEDWVRTMPATALQDCLPVLRTPLDPTIQGLKVIQALDSIRTNESKWRDMLAKVGDWSAASFASLSPLFPRTFNCQQYDRACEYTTLCFDPDRHSQAGFAPTPLDFRIRTPHHPQEGK